MMTSPYTCFLPAVIFLVAVEGQQGGFIDFLAIRTTSSSGDRDKSSSNVSAVSLGRSINASDKCTPTWQAKFSTCPYGQKLPGDVTFPDYAKAARLGAELPPHLPSDLALKLAVVYSYFPYIMALLFVIKLLLVRGTCELHFCFFLGFLVICNEKLVKPFVSEPRPMLSCLTSCGMPSSHAALSVGTLTLYVLHSVHRTTQRSNAMHARYYEGRFGDVRGASHSTGEKLLTRAFLSADSDLRRWFKVFWLEMKQTFSRSRYDEPSNTEVIQSIFIWMIFIMPVPVFRVVLGDHSAWQVCVGGTVGFISSSFWAFMSTKVQQCFQHRVGQSCCCGLLHHNLAMPCNKALRRIEVKLVSRRREQILSEKDETNLREAVLDEHFGELEFYEKETLLRMHWLCQQKICTQEEKDYLRFRWIMLQKLFEQASVGKQLQRYNATINATTSGGHPDQVWLMERSKWLSFCMNPNFHKGATVFVQGVEDALKLNGKRGTLVSFNVESSQWRVKIEGIEHTLNQSNLNLNQTQDSQATADAAEIEDEDIVEHPDHPRTPLPIADQPHFSSLRNLCPENLPAPDEDMTDCLNGTWIVGESKLLRVFHSGKCFANATADGDKLQNVNYSNSVFTFGKKKCRMCDGNRLEFLTKNVTWHSIDVSKLDDWSHIGVWKLEGAIDRNDNYRKARVFVWVGPKERGRIFFSGPNDNDFTVSNCIRHGTMDKKAIVSGKKLQWEGTSTQWVRL